MFSGFWADHQSKKWVKIHLLIGDVRPLVEGYVELSYTENNGMVFGILNERASSIKNRVLIGANLFCMVLFLYLIWKLRALRFLVHLPFFMILAGAAGNVIDRIRFGRVVDFIHIHWQGKLNWPYLFNVADILLCIGGLLLIVVTLVGKEDIREELSA